MKTIILLIISALLSACNKYETPTNHQDCQEVTPLDDPNKEDILVIGDSISIGYSTSVRSNLSQYEIVHNPCNGMTSVNGLSQVDNWLRLRPHWKLITFNHGLWDIIPFYHVNQEQYRAALIEEGTNLKAASDHVIFFTTTYVPPGAENRNNSDVVAYNTVAVDVMSQLGIPVYDLYAESLGVPLSEHLTPIDVHYTSSGYDTLGQFVTVSILDALTK